MFKILSCKENLIQQYISITVFYYTSIVRVLLDKSLIINLFQKA